MRVVYFGTPDFAGRVLSYLIRNGVDIVAVVTKPDRPKGRSGTPVPTPVKEVALSRIPPIPIYQPELVSSPDFTPQAASFSADLFVVVAYGEIIKPHLLEMPRLGCINLHASLLPKYRGAAPIQRALIEGETETGVTIMHMAKKMDAGDVVEVAKVPITPELTYGELESILCEIGSELLLKVIGDFQTGAVRRFPQDHDKATFAPKLEAEDCLLDWTRPASTLHNLVRGVNPHPGAWVFVRIKGEKKRLKILRTHVTKGKGSPGEILSFGKEGLIIACGEEALQISELQLEGKRTMKAEEFVQGFSRDQLFFIG